MTGRPTRRKKVREQAVGGSAATLEHLLSPHRLHRGSVSEIARTAPAQQVDTAAAAATALNALSFGISSNTPEMDFLGQHLASTRACAFGVENFVLESRSAGTFATTLSGICGTSGGARAAFVTRVCASGSGGESTGIVVFCESAKLHALDKDLAPPPRFLRPVINGGAGGLGAVPGLVGLSAQSALPSLQPFSLDSASWLSRTRSCSSFGTAAAIWLSNVMVPFLASSIQFVPIAFCRLKTVLAPPPFTKAWMHAAVNSLSVAVSETTA
mmetsp:Transcript_65187/g.172711  ORF Transcript_65187/g.172711 Transcript_65187/m.172711 type:complete len:270 (-) Transcript_65187:495-1304(-)